MGGASGFGRSKRVGVAAALAAAFAACSDPSGSSGAESNVVGARGAGGAAAGAAPSPVASRPDEGAAVAPGSTIFAVSYGDEHEQDFRAVTSDLAGNFYLAGFETGPTAPDPSQETPSDLFVVKYGKTGRLLWRQTIPSDAYNALRVYAAAVQPTTGSLILAGTFFGTATLGENTLTSGRDPLNGLPATSLWLAALDSAGCFVWSRSYPSAALASVDQAFTTSNGDIVLFGTTDEGGSVGGAPLCCGNTVSPDFDGPVAYVARYSPTGDFRWSNPIDGNFTKGYAGVNGDGDIVLGGTVHGLAAYQGVSFSGGGPQPGGSRLQEALVLRIDGEGKLIWGRLYPGPSQVRLGATIDAAKNVALIGSFSGTLDFGNGVSLTSGSNGNPVYDAALLARLGPDGTAQWAAQFPANGNDQVFAEAVATDAAGNIAFAGQVSGGLALGGPPPLSGARTVGFVAKYTFDGTFRYSRAFATETEPWASDITGLTIDPWGHVGAAGAFNATVDFGTGPLTPPGEPAPALPARPPAVPDNVFLLELAP
jgi:hypothetical protein